MKEEVMYGTQVDRWGGKPHDGIGEIGQTHAGNTYLRIGRENGEGWEQVAYIVLTPEETAAVVSELTEGGK